MAHFYTTMPEVFANLSNHEAVKRYSAGAPVPAESIVGLTSQQLLARPIPGTWSIQEIVVHLADADVVAAYRMKRIIAEDQPRLDVWDENAFVANLSYHKISASDTAQLFRANRIVMSTILQTLPDSAFDRIAIHPEVGEMTLGLFVRTYAHHLEHHMGFLNKKKAMLSR
jgi:hypothetical protein